MPGNETLWALLKKAKNLRDFWANPVGIDPKAKDVRGELTKAQVMVDHLQSMEIPSSRRIGTVVYSPPRVPKPRKVGNIDGQWLPDYAILELNNARFRTPPGDLLNEVPVGDVNDSSCTTLHKINKGFFANTLVAPSDGLLRLEGTLSDSDIRYPKEKNFFTDEFQLRVGKYGRTTKLT